MFLYGGYNVNSLSGTIDMDVVYVLSLPSFVWYRQNFRPRFGRYRHTCNLVGRQMIVVGGIVVDANLVTDDSEDSFPNVADPWSSGLGVFDVSDMEWRSEFDPDVAEYVTPEAVRSYLAGYDQYPAWSNSIVESWFTERRKSIYHLR